MRKDAHVQRAVLTLLESDGPSTATDLAVALRRPRTGVTSALGGLPPGLVHITGWERSTGTSGRLKPVYKLGAGKNAPAPKPLTRSEKSVAYRAKYGPLLKLKEKSRRENAPAPPWCAGLMT